MGLITSHEQRGEQNEGAGLIHFFFFGARSYPPMTGACGVIGLENVGLIGHSVRCLVRLLFVAVVAHDSVELRAQMQSPYHHRLAFKNPYRALDVIS